MTTAATRTQIEVRPVAGALGAEIHGVDLSKAQDDETVAAIRSAWLKHNVVFFRGQNLTSEQYMAFAKRLGRPVEYPFVKGLDGFPELTAILKLEHEKVNFGGVWHADTTYLPNPPMATMLLAREIPPYGGDTLFANQYLAYETLSETLRNILDGLTVVNTSSLADVSKTREDRIASDGRAEAKKEYVSEHPAVLVHPETGRKSLSVNVAHSSHFKGMSVPESQSILQFLFQHQVRPEFTCRFVWQVGSIAFWDNRCTQHNPINDYHGFRRLMHRITLAYR
jgi:taurine dioxygenase